MLQRMDRELTRVPRGRARVRQDRPRRDRHRPGAARRWSRPWSCSSRASEWRAGLTWDGLIAEMDEKLRYPGHAEHLVDADPDAHRDARDRHAQPARHQGVRRRPRDRSSSAAIAIEQALARRARARAAPSPSARPAASTSTSRSTASAAARYGVCGRGRRTRSSSRDRRHERRRRPSRAASATRSACATRASSATTRDALERVLVADARGAQVPLRAGGATSRSRTGPADDPQRGRPAGRATCSSTSASAPIADYVERGAAASSPSGDAAGRRRASSGPASSSTSSAPRSGCRLVRAAHARCWSRCCST